MKYFQKQKNNLSGATWIWAVVIVFLVVILVVTVGAFFKRTTSLNTEKSKQEESSRTSQQISYIRSVKDNEEMSLLGAHEFAIRDNYLYVTTVRDHGLEIMDITNPANPKHIGAFFDNDETLMRKIHSVALYSNYAFLGSMEDNAIQVLDISNPKNILPVKSLKLNFKEIGRASCRERV